VEDYQLLFCFYKSDKNTFTYLIENVRKSNNPEAFEKKKDLLRMDIFLNLKKASKTNPQKNL